MRVLYGKQLGELLCIMRMKDEMEDAKWKERGISCEELLLHRCVLMERYHEEDYSEVTNSDVLNEWSDKHVRVKAKIFGRFGGLSVEDQCILQGKMAEKPWKRFISYYNNLMKIDDLLHPYLMQWKPLEVNMYEQCPTEKELSRMEKKYYE